MASLLSQRAAMRPCSSTAAPLRRCASLTLALPGATLRRWRSRWSKLVWVL